MEQLLGLPPDGAAHGAEIDHLLVLLHWLMVILFVGWGVFFVYVLIRFRQSRQPKANYGGVKSHFSNYLEVGILVAEVILLVGFSIPMWSKRVDAFPSEKEAVVVRVVSEQFAWNIHYPGPDGKFGRTDLSLVDEINPLGLDRSDPDARDDIATINQLNLPVDKPVIIHLSSKDVIHSFGIPPYRIKQDAIPGMTIPLWFTPTKTTAQIREELRSTFSIRGAHQRTTEIQLPSPKKVAIVRNADLADYILLNDVTDNEGNFLLSGGDRLNNDNLTILLNAGVSEVDTRRAKPMDKFVAAVDYSDSEGNTIVAANELLFDDAVTRLIVAGITSVRARPVSNLDTYVALETKNDSNGEPIATKGEAMSEEIITRLGDAGIHEIIIGPATPTEIACAQLCGLGHYRMRGYATVQTAEEYQNWMDEQLSQLQDQATDSE